MKKVNLFHQRTFEMVCTEIVKKLGYDNVRHTAHQEFGYDISGQINHHGIFIKMIAECKTKKGGGTLYRSELPTTIAHVVSERPSIFLLFSNATPHPDLVNQLDNICFGINCKWEHWGKEKIEKFVDSNKIKVKDYHSIFLNRIERTEFLVDELETLTALRNDSEFKIRLRASYSSFANTAHHFANYKEINGLDAEIARRLDTLLLRERELFEGLISRDNTRLDLLFHKVKLGLPSYSPKDYQKRVASFDKFVSENRNSPKVRLRTHPIAAKGNQIILGKEIAIFAKNEKDGTRKTWVFRDSDHIEALSHEFDTVFNTIGKEIED